MNEQIEQQSWAGLARGDAEFWRKLLHSEIPKLYGMFMRQWPNPSLAEELVQKTVFDAVRGCAGFDPSKGCPEEWLFGIARNNIRLEIRNRANRPTVDGDITGYIEAIDAAPLPDEILERTETAQLVRTALSKLDEKEQHVLKAKYIENLSARDIASQTGATEKAVHSLLYRARESLRLELKRTAPLKK